MSATTLAIRIKEIMANMPNSINTKKEIDEYYKNAMKDIKEKNKEDKKEKKALPKKRVKKVEVDDDGNEIVKVKKPLNKYQKFIQDNRKKVKEENPGMSGEEIFTLITEMWRKHKEDIKDIVPSDEDDKKVDANKDSDSDNKVAVDSDSDEDIKEEKKVKGKNKVKKVKGEKKVEKESS